MKRLLTLGLLAVLALFMLPASPAHAIQYSEMACKNKSTISYNVTICVYYGWRMQNDGTGVHFENVRIQVVDGCQNDLEDQALSNVEVETENGGRNIGAQWNCDVTWDLEANGQDVGKGTAITTANVNVSAATDFDVTLTCEVYPNNGASECWPWYN